jgi:hypothetical protein
LETFIPWIFFVGEEGLHCFSSTRHESLTCF